ncbi:MAG: hypothetical protein RIQ89_1824 [Bacteroidota bacterium]|jgi:hypothetical protein
MNVRVANFISMVLHPVFMPMYALLLLFHTRTYISMALPKPMQNAMFVIVLIVTLVLPILIAYLLFKKNYIKSIRMDKREERIVPYICNILCLLLSAYMMWTLQIPRLFYLLMVGAALSVFITLLINFRWKMSIHMVGIGGIVGILMGLSKFLFVNFNLAIMIAIIVAGIAGTARLSLRAHTPMQLYTGFTVGFLSEYFILSLLPALY